MPLRLAMILAGYRRVYYSSSFTFNPSHVDFAAVERTPDAPNVLVQTLHWSSIQPPVLLSCAVP